MRSGQWLSGQSADPEHRPRLDAYWRDGGFDVRDTRPCAVAAEHRLEGLEAELYALCDSATSVDALVRGSDHAEEDVVRSLEDLVTRRLVIAVDRRYLSLAVMRSRGGVRRSRGDMKPRLHDHFEVRFQPPGASGEEGLVFTSERRRVVVKGHSFREFLRDVVPLLDGLHSLEEIHGRVKDTFDAEDLDTCLALLSEQGLLEDAETVALEPELEHTLGPQLNYFREVGGDPAELQDRLAQATVTVVGLGAFGAVAATALAASGVGRVRCVDHLQVTPTDPFLAQVFDREASVPRASMLCAPGSRL